MEAYEEPQIEAEEEQEAPPAFATPIDKLQVRTWLCAGVLHMYTRKWPHDIPGACRSLVSLLLTSRS